MSEQIFFDQLMRGHVINDGSLVSTSTRNSSAPLPWLPEKLWTTKPNVAARYITSRSSFTSLKFSFCRSFKVTSLKFNAIVLSLYCLYFLRSGSSDQNHYCFTFVCDIVILL